MSLLDTLLSIDGGGIVREVAKVFGLRNEVALEAVSQLVPALTRGLDRNSAEPAVGPPGWPLLELWEPPGQRGTPWSTCEQVSTKLLTQLGFFRPLTFA